MTALQLRAEALTKKYASAPVVDSFSIDVRPGEFLSLLGPSGCGKTTILRMVAGLLQPTAGRIWVGEREITRTPVHKRHLGLVFQNYALFPHMTVFENVAFGLRRRRIAAGDIATKVKGALDKVRLSALADRYPKQLSGGQQQRVAVARAIVTEPGLLLLDEPLSNLDAVLREEMRIELKKIQQEIHTTTLFVTHDQAEAFSMSDRICVLNRGRVAQLAAPEAVYKTPADEFVASFLGRSNMLRGNIEAGNRLRMPKGLDIGIQNSGPDALPDGAAAVAVLRHEAVIVARKSTAGVNSLPGRVEMVVFSGSTLQIVLRLNAGIEIMAELPSHGRADSFSVGERVFAEWGANDTHILRGDPASIGN
jgi:ABC-type Fe3+/spermidine/putrescine transport system ATPase subunit